MAIITSQINRTSRPNGAGGLANPLTDGDIQKQSDMSMQLFITYLKNQTLDDRGDPDKLMSRIENMMTRAQHMETNQILRDQTKLHEGIYQTGQYQILGKQVDYISDQFLYRGQPQEITITLADYAQEAALHIEDSYGQPIKTIDINPAMIQQKILFDGHDDFGQKVQEGVYRIIADASTHGNPIQTQVMVTLPIDHIESTADGQTILKSGPIVLDTRNIQAIKASA